MSRATQLAGVVIYWDLQNVRPRCNQELRRLEQFGSSIGKVVSRVVVAHWIKEVKWKDGFVGLKYKCINAIASREMKNNADRKLIDHAKNYALNNPKIHTVVLISGDGDFKQLVRELKAKNKRVILLVRDKKHTNRKLMELVDECYCFSAL